MLNMSETIGGKICAVIELQRLVPACQSLQLLVPVPHIDCDTEYAQTVNLLNSLLDVVRDNEQHPLYSLLSVVGNLIETYEIDHEPL